MAKAKVQAPLIETASRTFSQDKFLPVYLFFGADEFTIELYVKQIEKAFEPILTSDFDKEVIYGEDRTPTEIANLASAFPFGSERKLIIVKEFDKIKEKKNFVSYLKSPAEFTTLVLIGSSETSVGESEPYKTLLKEGYLFEAKELKGERLAEWVKTAAHKNGKSITTENAMLMIDISGESKDILDAQLEKIYTYLGDKKEIDHNAITSLSSQLKEYNIFDLNNAVGRKQPQLAIKIAYNLLDSGTEMPAIVGMLTRYFGQLARVNELVGQKADKYTGAKAIGAHFAFWDEYVSARKNFTQQQLVNSVRALLNADLAVKTSQADDKTIITMLIAEIFS